MRQVFSAVPHSTVSDKDVREYAPVLSGLMAQRGGRITPEEVVAVAKNPRSPLHRFFDWSDSSAANKYRLVQARTLIRSVRVLVIDEHGKRHSEKAFFNVNVEEDEEVGRVYVPVERVIESRALRDQVVQKALREAQDWRERYRRYSELEDIRVAIAKTARRVSAKTKAHRRMAVAK